MSEKAVLITGCSSGIGRALTEEFLRHGYRVYASARDVSSLSNLTSDKLTPLAMDVNQPADIAAATATIQAQSGQLNCLINNAGYAAMGPVAELSTDALHQQFATNVYAPIALTQAMLPLLRAAASAEQPAQVVNIGSVSGILTTPFSGAYCATKAALHSLSDALRMELAPFHIQVVTVQPGAIQSKFGDNSLANLARILTPQSLYAPLKAQMEARATASQDNPTPAADFARELMAQLLSKPDAVIRIGHGSRALPLMARLLPVGLRDKILSKKFGLGSLG
ncbi:SDR family oxidoreductase [Thalassolituus sp. LLYu03]|uniref:SDR family oxidoreductase n=1 Tax=Thalassolituus sp. LLYu03 TaxID=3421656 RepID=UPI003D27D5EA